MKKREERRKVVSNEIEVIVLYAIGFVRE